MLSFVDSPLSNTEQIKTSYTLHNLDVGQRLAELQPPCDGGIRQLEPPTMLLKEAAVPRHLLAQTLVAAVEEIAVK